MSDNITLPREAVEKAVKAFEKGCPPTCENDTLRDLCSVCLAFQRLRAALVTEQPSEDIEALRRENERLRADAERYRWLRSQADNEWGCVSFPKIEYFSSISAKSRFDAIDAYVDGVMKEAALRREGQT